MDEIRHGRSPRNVTPAIEHPRAVSPAEVSGWFYQRRLDDREPIFKLTTSPMDGDI